MNHYYYHVTVASIQMLLMATPPIATINAGLATPPQQCKQRV